MVRPFHVVLVELERQLEGLPAPDARERRRVAVGEAEADDRERGAAVDLGDAEPEVLLLAAHARRAGRRRAGPRPQNVGPQVVGAVRPELLEHAPEARA